MANSENIKLDQKMKQIKKENVKILELKRQLFHAIVGTIIAFFVYIDIFPLWLFFIVVITALIIYSSWKDKAQPIIQWFFLHFERKEEKRGSGALWYVIGCFLTVLLFEKNIALASIIILALGDSVSHWIGRFYGNIKHPLNNKKNVEGTIAGSIAAIAGAVFFVPNIPAVIASIMVMNLEVIPFKIGKYKVNDNFWIPLVAAAIMSGVNLL